MPSLADEIKQLLTQYDDKRRGFFRSLFHDPPAIRALRKLDTGDKNNIFKVYQCFVENLPKEGELGYLVYKGVMDHIPNESLDDQVSLLNFFIEENLATQHSSDIKASLLNFFIEENLATQHSSDIKASLLNFFIKENLTRQLISNIICDRYGDSVLRILSYLKYSQLLTRENLNDILYNGFDFLKALLRIDDLGPISQELLDLIKLSSIPRLAFVEIIIRDLYPRPAFINLQNLIRLLQLPEDSFLSTSDGFITIWHRIPTHLFTQAVFDQLITLSQQENPQQQLNHYVNQLIGFEQNQLGLNREFVLNDQQSTHRASVHQSVSDSASRLFKLYGLKIEGNHLQNTLRLIHDYIMQLPEDSIKNIAAKNAVKRIINLAFTDPGSGLTIQQLLALSYLGVNDKAKRIGDVSDALQQFVEGLYEIQRGYNLSETGVDLGGPDKPICIGGTFNKLIEKLEAIHPDVKVLHITPANASLKLPIVVREVALDYLESLAKPQTLEGLRRFTQLIQQIRQDECVGIIWDHIKPKIVDRMFDEFGSLYTGKADPRLNDLIESGQYLKLENLSRFQEQIMASPGYQPSSLTFFTHLSASDSDFDCSLQSPDRSKKFGS